MGESTIVNGKIYIYPTKIVIDPYYEKNDNIEKKLKVWDKATYSYSFSAFIHDEVKHTLTLPTTFSSFELKSFYPSYSVVDLTLAYSQLENSKKSNIGINMKYTYRDQLQKRAIDFLNRSKNSKYKRGIKETQSFLCLKTGQGKTFCAVKYIVDNNERPIIFIDKDALSRQWIERILEYTDCTNENIYYIAGKKSLEKLDNMKQQEIDNIKFFLCSYRTFYNYLKENEDYILNLLKKLNLTLKIYDEAHIEFMSIFKIDMLLDFKSIYLTATPIRSDVNENRVYKNIFKNVDKFFPEKVTGKINDKYHNVIIYNWSSNPDLIIQSACQTKHGFSMARYFDYLLETKYDIFFNKIKDILFNIALENRKKKKAAILFGSLAMLDAFYDSLVQYCADNQYNLKINKFSGKTKKSEKLSVLEESDIILTTDKSFKEGMDVRGLRVLINTVPFSSEGKLTQVVGRLREIENKEVFFIDVNDVGFEPIKRQLSLKKNKVYTVLGKTVFEIED